MIKPTPFASAIKNHTNHHTTKVLKKACKANPKKIVFKIFPKLQKKYKTQSTANPTMTR